MSTYYIKENCYVTYTYIVFAASKKEALVKHKQGHSEEIGLDSHGVDTQEIILINKDSYVACSACSKKFQASLLTDYLCKKCLKRNCK